MNDSPKQPLIYILGAGHCGSTLLNLLLNAHDDILGLSEVGTLADLITQADPQKQALATEFWRSVSQRYKELSGENLLDFRARPAAWATREVLSARPNAYMRWAQNQHALFAAAAEVADASVVVDSSKRWQRLYLLQSSNLFDIKVIYLVRDGRAVMNSYLRKYGDLRGLKRWMKSSIFAAGLRARFDSSSWKTVHYESLASNPSDTLYDLCHYLGVKYRPSMLDFRDAADHGIGGNRMREGDAPNIALDERWKRELTSNHKALFWLTGGWLNRLLGYHP